MYRHIKLARFSHCLLNNQCAILVKMTMDHGRSEVVILFQYHHGNDLLFIILLSTGSERRQALARNDEASSS